MIFPIFQDVPPPIIAVVDSSGQEIQVQVMNDGIMLTDLRVNGSLPATSGTNTGWVVTNNAINTISFNYSAPAGSVITLTDQRGNILGTWNVDIDTENSTISDSFTLPDGIGNYYLTATLTTPNSEVAAATIPVKYIALGGGDVCDQTPLPPECLPPVPPDTGEPEPPEVPGTGLKYVYIGGYAVPTFWVVSLILAIGGLAAFLLWVNGVVGKKMKFRKKTDDYARKTKK